jgi:branched-chain amino acid transport system permease protein
MTALVASLFNFSVIDSQSLMTYVVINVLMAWCLWLPISASQLSMSAPAAIGVGAYTGGYCAIHWTTNMWAGMALGAAAGALVGVPIGIIAMRGRDFGLAMMTLSFVLIIQVVETNWTKLTGGALGMTGVTPSLHVLRYGLIVLVAVVLFSILLARSRFGRTMDVIGHDEVLAAAVGTPILRAKLLILVVASLVGGVVGVLYVRYTSYIDPTLFGLGLITQLFAFVVLGGTGTFWGPVFGAALLTTALQVLTFAGQARNLIFGGVLIGITLLFHQGVIRRSRKAREWRFSRRLGLSAPDADGQGS